MDVRYAAGLLDGEGCIRITRQQFPNHVRYTLHVHVTMTDPRPLIELQKEFAGSFHWGTVPRNKETHRVVCSWHVGSRLAMAFLERVRPWLITKADEADLGMEFQRGIEYGQNSPEEIERRERLRREITALKHRTFDPADFGMGANSGNTQNGQSRAKQGESLGVCNEQVPPATAKMCSGLHGNMQSAAEMIAPRCESSGVTTLQRQLPRIARSFGSRLQLDRGEASDHPVRRHDALYVDGQPRNEQCEIPGGTD